MYLAVGVFCFVVISKLIAIEMLLVPQIAFSALIMIQKLESLLLPLSNLYLVNGYNNAMEANSSDLPSRITAMQYKSEFLMNYNINLLLVFFTAFVGAILFLVAKLILTEHKQKVKKMSFSLLKEWTLCMLLLFQFQCVMAIGIDVLYGKSTMGLACAAVFMLLMVVFAILLFKRPLNFG
jgi:hypothetical protein